MSWQPLFGSEFLIGDKSVLVYQTKSRTQKEVQFVLRVARYRPDLLLEWESLSHQGTIHLHRSAVQTAKIFHLHSFFEIGIDVESDNAMTGWLSADMYKELTEKESFKMKLNRMPVKMTLVGKGVFTLTVDKQVVEVPVIYVEDDRQGLWTFHENPENPILMAYRSIHFDQYLETISNSPDNKLRWIQHLPPIK